MAADTRQKILDAALDMFSERGFDGTNVRELTASLGLAKSSMYRHFKSKEEIWDRLLDQMVAYYDERFGSPEHLPDVPDTLEGLKSLTHSLVDFTIRDERVRKTRRLLTIEQFRDGRARELAGRHFLTGLEAMFAHVFAQMMERGLIRTGDATMVAFAYTAPITALIHLTDREPERTEEAIRRIEAFVDHFVGVYGIAGDGTPTDVAVGVGE